MGEISVLRRVSNKLWINLEKLASPKNIKRMDRPPHRTSTFQQVCQSSNVHSILLCFIRGMAPYEPGSIRRPGGMHTLRLQCLHFRQSLSANIGDWYASLVFGRRPLVSLKKFSSLANRAFALGRMKLRQHRPRRNMFST